MSGLYYRREVLENLYHQLSAEQRDEMAIPSYLHHNPLIRWLITKRMETILQFIDLQKNQTLLDFGCGVGMLFLQLPPQKGRYYGVDLLTWPAKMVLEAHQRTDATIFEADDWTDKIADNSIDCIVALEVLEHVDDVYELSQKFKPKLKTTGKLVICGPTENSLYQLARKIAGFSGDYHNRNIYDIMQDVEKAGFMIKNRTALPLPAPFTLFIASVYKLS